MSDKGYSGGKHSCAASSRFPKSVLLSMLRSIGGVLLSVLVVYTWSAADTALVSAYVVQRDIGIGKSRLLSLLFSMESG